MMIFLSTLFLSLVAAQSQPNINNGEPGADKSWKILFADEFSGSGDVLASGLWRYETMTDTLHRVGNFGIDVNGVRGQNKVVVGKRWSAYYNLPDQTQIVKRVNGWLHMGAAFTNEQDLSRPTDYDDMGTRVEFGKHRFYVPWIDTWARTYSEQAKGQITDPASPDKTFKYGFFEMKCDFSGMQTQGLRFSAWLMPAYDDDGKLMESNAYNSDPADGVEVDILEYETGAKNFGDLLQMKVIGVAGKGNTKPGFARASEFGVDIRKGSHTIGLLWEPTRLVWYLDGQKVMEDTERVPQVYSYVILSREANSGVKGPNDGVEADDVRENIAGSSFIPRDPGLYATNIYLDRAKVNSDVVRVDYMRVFQESEETACVAKCKAACGGGQVSACRCTKETDTLVDWRCAHGLTGVALPASNTFAQARKECTDRGMDVVIPENAAMNADVLKTCETTWLGFQSKNDEQTLFTFSRVDNKGELGNNQAGSWNAYQDWAQGEPNRWKFASGARERCVAIENGHWNDRPCEVEASKGDAHPKCVVCDGKAPAATTQPAATTPPPPPPASSGTAATVVVQPTDATITETPQTTQRQVPAETQILPSNNPQTVIVTKTVLVSIPTDSNGVTLYPSISAATAPTTSNAQLTEEVAMATTQTLSLMTVSVALIMWMN